MKMQFYRCPGKARMKDEGGRRETGRRGIEMAFKDEE